jgi:hypothetical protein
LVVGGLAIAPNKQAGALSCQFGRSSAPMAPQKVHAIRSPIDGNEEDVNGLLFEQSLCPSSFLNRV